MSNSPNDVSQRLLALLSHEDLRPGQLETGLKEFSAEVCRDLMAQLVAQHDVDLPGRVVFRLLHINLPETTEDLTKILIAHLKADDPEARKAALYGLGKLEHPEVIAFALDSIQDDSNSVVAHAIEMLRFAAEEDPSIRQRLQKLYGSLTREGRFRDSCLLLEAHGLVTPSPEQ